ncbi:MAG: TolC family protein, partial [Anaerohalosphaera sp.]|nr:TolC family protein [Anaerohalosphaera sp.]
EHNALYQIRTFNRFRKEFAVSTITGYYRVLEQQEKEKNAEDNYLRLNKVFEQISQRAEVGKFPQHELDQARQDVLQAKDNFIREQKLSKQILDDFKLFLAIDPGVEIDLDAGELAGLVEAGLDGPKFSEEQAIETAIEQRLDLANSSDAVIDAQRKVELALDSIRAELNLVAGTEQSSKKIGGTGKNSVGVGVELDLPIDRKEEKAAYRRALLTLNQYERDHAEAVDNVTAQVRKAYRDLKEAAEIYEVQLANKKLAAHRFDNTTVLLQYGRASTRDILDSQEDYFKAQDEATTALVDHTIAMLNFYRDAGVLDVKADGGWQITEKN